MLNTSESVRSIRTEDGRVVLDTRHGQMFSVNVVGSKILDLIENGWDEELIAAEISRTCGTSIEIVRTDVHSFIEALRSHSIVEGAASGESGNNR